MSRVFLFSTSLFSPSFVSLQTIYPSRGNESQDGLNVTVFVHITRAPASSYADNTTHSMTSAVSGSQPHGLENDLTSKSRPRS